MAITIKKATEVKTTGPVLGVSKEAKDPGEPAKAPDWWQPVPAAIDEWCAVLRELPAESLGMRDDVKTAMNLGFGSAEARAALDHGIITAEWPQLIPWFTRPDAGDWILPADAVWEIHRLEIEGGYGGWATLSMGGKNWSSNARTPWAAFAICLMQAFKDGAYVPRPPLWKK